MKANEMTNLWVGYNETEDFRILICASDEVEAQEVANSYKEDTNMNGEFLISEFTDVNQKFDCDYVVSAGN